MSPKPFLPNSNRRRRTARLWARGACLVNWDPDWLCDGCIAFAGSSRGPDRRHRRGAWCSLSFFGDEIWHVDRLRIDWWTADRADDGCGGLGIAKLKQEMPAPPNPQRHAKAASRIAVAEGMGALAGSGRTLAVRPVLPAAIGLASVGLLGWLIASRRNARKTRALEPE